jgi:hypothetical protein
MNVHVYKSAVDKGSRRRWCTRAFGEPRVNSLETYDFGTRFEKTEREVNGAHSRGLAKSASRLYNYRTSYPKAAASRAIQKSSFNLL